MNTRSTDRRPYSLPTLAFLEEFSLHDLTVFLLKLLAHIYPRGTAFWLEALYSPGSLCRSDGEAFAPGDPDNPIMVRIRYLLNTAWPEIVRNGYVTELPRRRGWHASERWFDISAEGWAAVRSITRSPLPTPCPTTKS